MRHATRIIDSTTWSLGAAQNDCERHGPALQNLNRGFNPKASPVAQAPFVARPTDTLEPPATWRSGYAAACKAVYTGSIPVVASANRL
jgi:hypothetical protein